MQLRFGLEQRHRVARVYLFINGFLPLKPPIRATVGPNGWGAFAGPAVAALARRWGRCCLSLYWACWLDRPAVGRGRFCCTCCCGHLFAATRADLVTAECGLLSNIRPGLLCFLRWGSYTAGCERLRLRDRPALDGLPAAGPC